MSTVAVGQITISDIMDGKPGQNGIAASLTSDSHVVPTDTNGNNGLYAGCATTIELYEGGKKLTTGVTYSFTPSSGITGSGNSSTGTYTVTTMSVDSAYVDLKATYEGTIYVKRFTVTKAKQGQIGQTGGPGPQGIPGPKGDNGQTLYTWLKYADTPTTGMSDSPNNKAYIGLAYNKPTPNESTNYSDYTWSLIKGSKGDQGVPGPPGANGQSLYTWIKYADDVNGAGMSDSPNGKKYIGLAYNKTSQTESTNARDYSWSLISETIMLNNFSVSGDISYGWLKESHFSLVASDDVGYYGKITTNDNITEYSDLIEIEPTKSYKVTLMIKNPETDTTNTGTWYFGIFAYDKYKNNIGVYMNKETSLQTNPYFYSQTATAPFDWKTMEGYIHAHNIDTSKVMSKGNVWNSMRFDKKCKYIRIRFLNFRGSGYGAGKTGSFYYAHPSISETDNGALTNNPEDVFNALTDFGKKQGLYMQDNQLYINGEYIKANTIDVNKLKANSISTDKLQSNSISTDKLKANSISADKLQTNSVIASKIAAGAITADKLIVGAGDVSYGNLATGKAISGTSLSNQNVVNDGNKNIGSTYCGFGSGNSSNNSDERDYVQIDLGKVYRVSESKIYFYAGDTRSYWYKIKYSADGTNWYYAIGNSSNTGWAQSSLPITTSGINPTYDTFSIPIAARYIRLYANGSTANGGNHIYEWELFSKSSSQIDGAIITTGILNASLVNITNMNASNINTGNLVVGGTNNRDGAIIVKNSSNEEMARMDKNGVVVNNTGYFIKDEYGILNNVNRPANKIVDAKFQMGLKFDHDGIVGNDTFFDNKDYYIKSLQNVEYWDYVKIDEIRYANGHFNSGYPGAALRKTPEIVSLIASTKAEPYQEWSKIGDTAYISKVDTCLGSIIDATNKNNEFTFSTYAAGVKTKDLTYSGPWTLRVRVVPQVVQQPMGGVYKTVWDTASTITRDITISSYSEMRRFATTFNKSHFSSINGDGLTGKFFVCFGSPHATNRIVMNGFQIVDGSKASLLDNGVDNTFINGKQIYGSLKVEHVQMGDPSLNQVNPGMTCYGNSAFHNHMYIENNSTINITGTGQINSPAFNLNGYKNWDTGNFSGTGGGAAIVNDNGSYKALMILGNSTAGGVRLVRVWDELRVEGKKFQVSGNMTMGEMGNDMDSIKTEKSILFTTAKYKNVMVANAFFDGANDVHIDKANGASQIVLEKNSWPKFRWSNAGSGTNGIAQWGAYYNMLTDSPSQGVAMQRGDAYRPNFNDYTYSGIWQVNMDGGNTNGPNTYPYGLLAVFASNGTIGQLYFPHSGSHPLHYRCKWSTGIWTNWANVGWSA